MFWLIQISCVLSMLAISSADGSKLGPPKNIASLFKILVIFMPGGLWTMIADFISLSSKITADGDCSHEIKRPLLLGRKAMTNLDSMLKSRDITLPTNVHLVKAMVFPVVLYGYENWTIKKAEHQMIDSFELWCLRRLLRVPWTGRRSSQSILKEISPEYSLEGLMLKLKLQYFGHLMWRTDSLENTLMLGKNEDSRRRGWQRMKWLDGLTDSMDMSLRKLWVLVGQESLACCGPWDSKKSDTTEQLNCTEERSSQVTTWKVKWKLLISIWLCDSMEFSRPEYWSG